MTMLYQILCYKEVCYIYIGTRLYIWFRGGDLNGIQYIKSYMKPNFSSKLLVKVLFCLF